MSGGRGAEPEQGSWEHSTQSSKNAVPATPNVKTQQTPKSLLQLLIGKNKTKHCFNTS